MIRIFFVAILALAALPSFAGTFVLHHDGVIKTDYASRGVSIRDIRRKATLEVSFVPRNGVSDEEARQHVSQVLRGPFFSSLENVPCYPSNKKDKGITEKVRVERWAIEELEKLPLKAFSVTYTCR